MVTIPRTEATKALHEIENARALKPVPFAEVRQAALCRALEGIAETWGVPLRKPLQFDSRGEILISSEKELGAPLAGLLTYCKARTGYPGPNSIQPHSKWCMLNHFALEKLVETVATSPEIWAVIHIGAKEAEKTALENAIIASEAGCHGVFLISHGHPGDFSLNDIALAIKNQMGTQSLRVGINQLNQLSNTSLQGNQQIGIEATWTDDPIRSDEEADPALLAAAHERKPEHLLFVGVGFKYQREDPNPEEAARKAAALGFIPTTSGTETGKPASKEKLEAIQASLKTNGEQHLQPLAVASGVDETNIDYHRQLTTHLLVATSISKDFHNLDEEKTKSLVRAARSPI